MTIVAEPSPVRRWAASAALLSSAGVLGIGVLPWYWKWERLDGVMAGATGALVWAAFGLRSRGLPVQIAARAISWLVLVPALLLSFLRVVSDGQVPSWQATLLALGTTAALLLARPMLHTQAAHRSFAPIASRTWFLAGATTSAAVSVVAALAAVDSIAGPWFVASCCAVSGLYASAAIGVLRMRAWGVLLGGATAAGLLAVALSRSDTDIAFYAIPGVLLTMPLLIARARRSAFGPHAATSASTTEAVASAVEPADETAYRVHAPEEPAEEEPEVTPPREQLAR
jgi:hypothetical protein